MQFRYFTEYSNKVKNVEVTHDLFIQHICVSIIYSGKRRARNILLFFITRCPLVPGGHSNYWMLLTHRHIHRHTDVNPTINLYTYAKLVSALSGKFEEMQYNEVNDFDETPDVSELEALKRSYSARVSFGCARIPVMLLLALYATVAL